MRNGNRHIQFFILMPHLWSTAFGVAYFELDKRILFNTQSLASGFFSRKDARKMRRRILKCPTIANLSRSEYFF